MHISFNSAGFFRLLYWLLFLSVPQRLSIGLRSGDWLGHWRTLIFLSLNHSRVKFVVVLWEHPLEFLNKRFTLGMRLLSNIWRYMELCIFSSMMWSAPVPREVKHAHTIIYYTTSVPYSWFGICKVIRYLLCPRNMMNGIATRKFNFSFNTPNDSLPISISIICSFAKLKRLTTCCFVWKIWSHCREVHYWWFVYLLLFWMIQDYFLALAGSSSVHFKYFSASVD